MINLTDRVQVSTSDSRLHRAVLRAVSRCTEILERQHRKQAGARNFHEFAFVNTLRKGTLPEHVFYDAGFLHAIFDISQGTQGAVKPGLSQLSRYTLCGTPPASGVPALRRGLKLLLIELWRVGAITLPTVFLPGPHFPYEEFDHELLNWVRRFPPSMHDMYYYGTRLLLATNWARASDISLQDLAELATLRALYRTGVSQVQVGGGQSLPLSQFPAHALRAYPSGVAFSPEQLSLYSNWLNLQEVASVPFTDYLHGTSKPSRRRSTVASVEHGDEAVRGRGEGEFREGRGDPIASHDRVRINFKRLKGVQRAAADWRKGGAIRYPGREHLDVSSLTVAWIECFTAYLNHRTVVKGYRSNQEAVAALNLLADYLFYYLPWWKELFPDSRVTPPPSPKEFSRYAFVARHTPAQDGAMPDTLLQMARLRRPAGETFTIAVHQIAQFFSFVEIHFSERPDIAGVGFRNPVNAVFDAPKVRKAGKTNKEVIPRQIYGHLLFYCYAVEEFGMHLERLALSGTLGLGREQLRTAQQFTPADFGFNAQFIYRGRVLPVPLVPNVYAWREREIASDQDQSSKEVYVPHLTALRLLLVALETGLRAQSVQWLDRRTWRSLAHEVPPDSYTYPILVNTDKTKTKGWETFVVHRVWALLSRQEQFQQQFRNADAFGPVNYEGHENSPFDPILPLFRSPHAAGPIGDITYSRCWQRLMVHFESFYRDATGERHVRMYKLQPRRNEDGTAKIAIQEDSRAYCPISILPIHTPHACRATFATNRKGILELSDTAQLLGHSNIVVTAHYDKPNEAQLRERLQDSDRAMTGGYRLEQAFVRADREDSALVSSFVADRSSALRTFKFMPPLAIWSTSEADGEEGLKLLRDGPMSRIRFRETHICPVGEECPAEILEQIGSPRRCGCCPLAMKCIDHLPAIAARKNQLLQRVRFLVARRDEQEAAGEPGAVLDETWDSIEADVNELLGWQASEQVLEKLRTEDPGTSALLADRPQVIRDHLRRVTKECDQTELMLQRIVDSNAFPGFSSPEVELAARQIRKKLLVGKVDAIPVSTTGSLEDVRGVAAMLKLMMTSRGIPMRVIADSLNSEEIGLPALLGDIHDAGSEQS